jgi:NADH-quinone oxidoreductase subunit I
MKDFFNYIESIYKGIVSLLTGMRVTMRVFFREKSTEQYPENRATLVLPDRFKGELSMPHNDQNQHKCVACRICETNCPNGTIRITTDTITDEDGKTKKILNTYEYDLGSCIFCDICVMTCPYDAIKFDTTFENSYYTRSKLLLKLNHEGSSLAPKPKVAKEPIAPKTKIDTKE